MNTKIPGYSFFKDHMRHLRMSIFGCTVVANLIILLNTRGPGNEGLSDEGFHDDLVSVIRDEAHRYDMFDSRRVVRAFGHGEE